jgi:hypothetical protein
MKIMQFMGAALTVTMLAGPVAFASTTPTPQSAPPAAAQQSDATTLPALAANSPQTANILAAPQVNQQPKKLPLADFGQWDEAASEN